MFNLVSILDSVFPSVGHSCSTCRRPQSCYRESGRTMSYDGLSSSFPVFVRDVYANVKALD
jgi:hypothetical protein